MSDRAGLVVLDAPARTIEQALDAMYASYEPGARKRGRNPRWPFVPIVLRPRSFAPGQKTEEQLNGRAFATREDAVDYAARTIAFWREESRKKLATPSYRAFREQWGVAEPEEWGSQ